MAQPYQNPTDRRIRQNIANGSPGRMPYSWFYFNLVKNVSKEKTFHSCQIPEKLSASLIEASTQPGDVVFIPFGGSGAEISVCLRNGRHFIAAEIDPVYYQMILDRIAREGAIDRKYRLIERIRERKRDGTGAVNQASQLRLVQEHAEVVYQASPED
ncbi:MAG: DNA methyltransferase [Chloroflexota bacterium]